MNIILAIGMELFGVVVGIKLIMLGLHWVKEVRNETRDVVDHEIHEAGRKIRERNKKKEDKRTVYVRKYYLVHEDEEE